MSSGQNLHAQLSRLLGSLSGFSLGADERVELTFVAYPLSRPETVVRYETFEDASSTLLSFGPSCEAYLSLADAGSEFPTPADPKKLLAYWRMRRREEDELGLDQPVTSVRPSSFREPSLVFISVIPAD